MLHPEQWLTNQQTSFEEDLLEKHSNPTKAEKEDGIQPTDKSKTNMPFIVDSLSY